MDAKAESAKWAVLRAHMQELMGNAGWDYYMAELEKEEARLTNILVNAPSEEHDLVRGQILGLRWAAFRPEKIVKLAQGA